MANSTFCIKRLINFLHDLERLKTDYKIKAVLPIKDNVTTNVLLQVSFTDTTEVLNFEYENFKLKVYHSEEVFIEQSPK
jgi:hypothetical protein